MAGFGGDDFSQCRGSGDVFGEGTFARLGRQSQPSPTLFDFWLCLVRLAIGEE